jgi:hypothetical protein
MIDGRKTVRQLIQSFAQTHRLNLREAEVAMMTYLRTLASRGIVTMRGAAGSTSDAQE